MVQLYYFMLQLYYFMLQLYYIMVQLYYFMLFYYKNLMIFLLYIIFYNILPPFSSDASGHLKLADFGLSKIVSPIASSGFDPTGPVDEEDFRNASATVAINLIKSILPLKVSKDVLDKLF